MASSSSKETPDQTEMVSGHCFYPYAGEDVRFQIHGRKSDPTFPSINSSVSCSFTPTNLSSSFPALLSAPATLLQIDIQELSSPKLFGNSTEMANKIGCVVGTPFGHQVPLASMWPSKITNYQNLQSRNDLYPTVSSSAKACSSFGSSSVFQSSYPAVNISFQGSDPAKPTTHHTVFGNEIHKDFHSLEGGVHSMSVLNDVKIQNVNHQMLQKVPVEVKRFASDNSSNDNSGCPRVFCLDKSGNLLLSNTGLLGILCSCHCFHMSVSRFCEHSGLQDANPGDSIRMDSGETIAQWRKLYFQRCGIRVPEDQCGWDWPEGLSLTANLMKSGVSTSNMLKHSECSNLVGPSDDLLRSGWPLGSVSRKNFLVNKNSVIDDLHDKQQRSVQDYNKIYVDGLVYTSKNKSCDLGYNNVPEFPTSRCPAMPKFSARGLENIHEATNVNAFVKDGGSSTAHLALQDQKNLARNFAVSRDGDVHDFSVIDKVASSSSIELKLGQPCQQSHRPGNPVVGPMFYNTTADPQKSFSQEQNIHNVLGCMVEEESRAHVPHAVGLSNFTRRREQNHLNFANYALGNTLGAAKLKKLNGNTIKGSVVSLFPQNTLSEGGSQSTAANLLNVNEHAISGIHQYHSVNCNSSSAPVDSGNDLGRQRVNPGLKSCNDFYNSPSMHDESRYSMCSSYMPPGASDAGNFSKSLEKARDPGSSGHTNHFFFRPKCSPGGYTQNLLSQGVPICSVSSTPNSTPRFVAATSHQDGRGTSSYLLDDSLRMLRTEQTLKLSRNQHVMSSLEKNLELEKNSDPCNVKIRHSFIEPSMLEEQRRAPNLTKEHGVSEVDMKMKPDHSDPPNTKVEEVEKLTPLTGFSRWCNNPTSKAGIPLRYDGFGKHCQLSHNPFHYDQSPLRLGGSQTAIYSDGRESCYKTTPSYQCKCSSVDHTNCLGRNCKTIGGKFPNLREQARNLNSKTPSLIASPFVNDHFVPKENVTSFNQCGRLTRQLPKSINCSSPQWNDVPKQGKRFCELACIKQSANALDGRRHDLFQLEDKSAKYSNGTVHAADSFKELDVSTVSSSFSRPTVTPASIDITNADPSTVVGNTGCANSLIVDEGSSIDKCWSSDDAIESDTSDDFYGCKSSLRRHKYRKVTSHNSGRNLLEEVKLMDSLTWKKGENLKHTGNDVHWKRNQSQEPEKHFKPVKRKRERKLKMLDSISGTEVPSLLGEGSECGSITGWHCLSKNVKMGSCGPESSRASTTHSIKINPEHRNSKITVTGALSSESNFLKNSDAEHCDDDNETVGEQIMMHGSENCTKTCSSRHFRYCNRKAKPVVCGKYGEITNGNMREDLLERVKIVSLEWVLKTAKRCLLPKRYKSGLTSSKELNRKSFGWRSACHDKSSILDGGEIRSSNALMQDEVNNYVSIEEKDDASSTDDDDEQCDPDFSMMGKKYQLTGKGHITRDSSLHAHLRLKHKETRKRSLYELTSKGRDESSCDPTTIEADHLEENEASCARTEGYKGRKRDGFWHNINSQSKEKVGCFVHQEQLNAWNHINGQKSCANGLFKLPMSEKEYDYRNEYAKRWNDLVVYKSGIHALGLYTSRFISSGEMVVEYVGEIVGLRVADKRENEYQSGRRLQYKSASYFFKIDKEHIIDATCKGGIARFVNHSCSPNCIARVISVRKEKKVVFFAERDIYPGEEITYDYHFNHEDEGEKIPCFCNAKNCRRYLN